MGHNDLPVLVKITRPLEGKFAKQTYMESKSRRKGWHHCGSKRPMGKYMGHYPEVFKAVVADPIGCALAAAERFGICWCGGPTTNAELHRPCLARLERTLAG